MPAPKFLKPWHGIARESIKMKSWGKEVNLEIEESRKAKLSYYPLDLCPVHALVFKK